MKVYILRVFIDEKDNFGDYSSIVIDEGRHISDKQRKAITRELKTGETIFVNSISDSKINVMHRQGEISFAGFGVLATAWLLTKLGGKPVEKMVGRDGDIAIRQEGDITWASTFLKALPQWNLKHLDNVADVERINLEETFDMQHTLFWSWIDKEKDMIRARTFAKDWDIPEAEANGSGAMPLATKLGREVVVRHRKGSVIYAKPEKNESISIGGRVIREEDMPL